ncbi:MAG: rubrerythrin, partial [Desulfamplus sp.]|nr:rubrerythrin [Desulfamplus sp.]
KLYQYLAADSSSEDIKNIFEDLATMEQGHKFKMEQSYNDVAYAEEW